jgi:hypothetical protein
VAHAAKIASSAAACFLQTLPREMVLCHSLDAAQLAQMWLPAEPVGVPEPPINK